MSNINDHINHLAYAQRQQNGVNAQVQQALGDVSNRMNALQSQIVQNGAPNQQPSRPMQIEDIPGLRTPRWYEVDIDFSQGDSAARFNSAEIAPDGPFVITQCAPWWTITDTNGANFYGAPANAPTGRVLPCSATPFLLGSGITSLSGSTDAAFVGQTQGIGDLFNGAGTNGALSDIPEFSFQIEIQGSGRFWTNQAIPAAEFYGWGGQPNYLGIQGWVERTDRITVHATPENTRGPGAAGVPHNGRVRFVFCGYQILGPINIAEALGT